MKWMQPYRYVCVLLTVCLLGSQTVLAQIDRGLQGPSRWVEHAYGMSVVSPPGAQQIEQTDDGALVKFLTQDPATISIYIRKSGESELTLPAVKDKALREFGFMYPSAVTLEQDAEPVTVAERQGLGLYLLVPDDKHGNWVFAQVYTLIDPHTLAIYQLDCDAEVYDRALTTFLNLIGSVRFADPMELDRERNQRIDTGRKWLDSLKREQIKAVLIPEQWLRIIQDGKDVGYMRIRQTNEKDHVPPGIGVAVQSRIVEGNNTYDTEGVFFEADDRTTEFWTITTTLRSSLQGPQTPGAMPTPPAQNWRQTGLRDGRALEVSQETPTRIKKLPWKLPPFPYLSQVDLYVLPALFPRDGYTEMAFYSFHQNAQKLSLRTFRIEPQPDGSYRVYERPTPDRPEQVATYSPTGRLIERRMTNGRVYLATTPQELKRIWGGL
ncbi:MAG: hypothetical protein Kow00105_06980 [Phycisphaeraceae bacterium]